MKADCDGDNIGKRYNVRTRGYYHDWAINRLSPHLFRNLQSISQRKQTVMGVAAL